MVKGKPVVSLRDTVFVLHPYVATGIYGTSTWHIDLTCLTSAYLGAKYCYPKYVESNSYISYVYLALTSINLVNDMAAARKTVFCPTKRLVQLAWPRTWPPPRPSWTSLLGWICVEYRKSLLKRHRKKRLRIEARPLHLSLSISSLPLSAYRLWKDKGHHESGKFSIHNPKILVYEPKWCC